MDKETKAVLRAALIWAFAPNGPEMEAAEKALHFAVTVYTEKYPDAAHDAIYAAHVATPHKRDGDG